MRISKLLRTKRAALGLLGLVGAFPTSSAFGWGHAGHQIVAGVGSRLASQGNSFWLSNAPNMSYLTNVPDMDWKRKPTAVGEKPNHWFQPDSYFADPAQFSQIPRKYSALVSRYTEKVVIEYGTAPWRIRQFYDLGVNALRAGDFVVAVQMAGAMSHYVGDLSQPLHVTENYDGQKTKDPGVHKYFETDNIEATDRAKLEADVESRARALVASPKFRAQVTSSIVESTFREVVRAYAWKDRLIEIDLRDGRSAAGNPGLLEIATERMADGAATLALILGQMWTDSGNAKAGATVVVKGPQWVAPNFVDETGPSSFRSRSVKPLAKLSAFLERDDCDE